MIKLKFPTKYIAFTQYFSNKHKAVDIANAVTVGSKKYDNKSVYMCADGIITQNAYASDYGWFVEYKVVDDEGNIFIIADGHFNKQSSLKVGQKYPMGTLINKMGNKGTSLGVHDHHRVSLNGSRVNPLNYEYVYPDQVVGTLEKATLKYYTPEETKPTEKDDTKVKELEAEIEKLNASLKEKDNKINELNTYISAQEKTIQELNDKLNLERKTNESHQEQMAELQKENDKLKEEIRTLDEELKESGTYKDIYNITEDGTYEIDLKSGEVLKVC